MQDAVDLALLEGLHGHARSAQKRLVAATSDAGWCLSHRSPLASRALTKKLRSATTSAEHSTALLAPMPREPVTINFALPKGRMMDNILALLKGGHFFRFFLSSSSSSSSSSILHHIID